VSRTPAIEMRRLELEVHPGHETVVAKAVEFVVRKGWSASRFAEAIGVGESTVTCYLRGEYKRLAEVKNTQYMDARVWTYITRHWPQPEETNAEPLLETQGFRQILDCIEDAVETGASSIIYGPPSSEKSFVAEQIVAQYRAGGRRDLIYVLCTPNMTPLGLMRAIARTAEVWVRAATVTNVYLDALVAEFRARKLPPAIIADEAQHLPADSVEMLRIGLHERTKGKPLPRGQGAHKGCGMVLLGSHTLYSYYMHPARRFRYEQLLSRISHRVQLTGMGEDEVLELAARALGANGKKAKLTDLMRERLLASCRVIDPYATDADGKPLLDEKGRPTPRTYYSSRRLLDAIRQRRRAGLHEVIAETVV